MQTYIFCKQVPLSCFLAGGCDKVEFSTLLTQWRFPGAVSLTVAQEWVVAVRLTLCCLSLCSRVPSTSPCPGAFFPWSGSYLWLFHSPWVLDFTLIPKGLATNWLKPGWGLWTHLCFGPPYCCWVSLVASLLVLPPTYDTFSTRAVLVLCHLSVLSLQAGCSCTVEGHPVSLWAISFSSEVFLNAYPFKLKECWMLLLLHILPLINVLQGSSRDLILVIGT